MSAKTTMLERAAQMRTTGDVLWERGDKEASTRAHREAAELEESAKLLPDERETHLEPAAFDASGPPTGVTVTARPVVESKVLDFSRKNDKARPPPEGFEVSVLAPGQIKRCTSQDHAMQYVRMQMQRSVAKLEEKKIAAFFTFTLYAINCDQHAKEGLPMASHVDLVTTALDELKPEGLHHVIAAAEAMLVQLKARQS